MQEEDPYYFFVLLTRGYSLSSICLLRYMFPSLKVCLRGETYPRDPTGQIALAKDLREHTALQEFSWIDVCARPEAAPRELSPDLVLRAFPACPHLQKVFI
jgi:hypothetical protein